MLYPIAVEIGDEKHAYGVIVPDVAGCFSAGDTFEEALENAKEAIVAHIEILVEDGEKVPLPSVIDDYINKETYKGFVFAVVDVDLTHVMGKAEKINITLPKLLIKRIDDFVQTHIEYKSRSGFLASIALEKISKQN